MLDERLEELRRQVELDKDFPDVVAIWEAIYLILVSNRPTGKAQGKAAHQAENQTRRRQGRRPYPFPEWINDCLLRAADKIGRLWLGISPEDDRPLHSMVAEELAVVQASSNSSKSKAESGLAPKATPPPIGKLRKVRQADRERDVRVGHVPSALGFVRKGASAFQHHDRVTRDTLYLRIYDDPQLQDNKPYQREVRQALVDAMIKNEHIGTEEAVRNRISKARTARQRTKGT